MASFSAFLFVAIVWMSNGSPEPPVARLYASAEQCLQARDEFVAAFVAAEKDSSPAMHASYTAQCHLVTNDSEARDG